MAGILVYKWKKSGEDISNRRKSVKSIYQGIIDHYNLFCCREESTWRLPWQCLYNLFLRFRIWQSADIRTDYFITNFIYKTYILRFKSAYCGIIFLPVIISSSKKFSLIIRATPFRWWEKGLYHSGKWEIELEYTWCLLWLSAENKLVECQICEKFCYTH